MLCPGFWCAQTFVVHGWGTIHDFFAKTDAAPGQDIRRRIRRFFDAVRVDTGRGNMNLESIATSELVNEAVSGNRVAADRLMQAVYDKLHGLAADLLRHESPAHTLQPTALVNEAYLRMVDQNRVDWKGTTHFYAVSARMMRRILVDHARAKKREKRGRGMRRIELTDDLRVTNHNDEDVLAVDDAINKLAKLEPRHAEIVELRFFGGLTVAQVAEALHMSKRTVEADWTLLRAWLRRELSGSADS